jgi:hypothetical protein
VGERAAFIYALCEFAEAELCGSVAGSNGMIFSRSELSQRRGGPYFINNVPNRVKNGNVYVFIFFIQCIAITQEGFDGGS